MTGVDGILLGGGAGLSIFLMTSPALAALLGGGRHVPDWVWRYIAVKAPPPPPVPWSSRIGTSLAFSFGVLGLVSVPVFRSQDLGPVAWAIVVAELTDAAVWLALLYRWR
jgi:hypothetical protein